MGLKLIGDIYIYINYLSVYSLDVGVKRCVLRTPWDKLLNKIDGSVALANIGGPLHKQKQLEMLVC